MTVGASDPEARRRRISEAEAEAPLISTIMRLAVDEVAGAAFEALDLGGIAARMVTDFAMVRNAPATRTRLIQQAARIAAQVEGGDVALELIRSEFSPRGASTARLSSSAAWPLNW